MTQKLRYSYEDALARWKHSLEIKHNAKKRMAEEWNMTAPVSQEQSLPPYTMEEIHAMIAQAERESAAGLGQDSEEMFRELEEEFAREDRLAN